MDLSTPLLAVKGVGPRRAEALREAGFETVGDLLYHLPRRYEDRRHIASIAEVSTPGPVTLLARLAPAKMIRTRRRGFTIVRSVAQDASGTLPITWFNQPYLARQLVDSEEMLLHGDVRASKTGWELLNPSCERAADALLGGRVVAIYPALGTLGPALSRRILAAVLAECDPEALVPELLPEELLRRHALPGLGRSLAELHMPGDEADVELLNSRRSPAQVRLIYGELFEQQLELAWRRSRRVRVAKAHKYRIDDHTRQIVRSVLPFRLTSAQKRVVREIVADLGGRFPMLRLLQGDVGSGKTVVAAIALVLAMESGLQAAFMAPTELLAEQHFATLRRLLGTKYRMALLRGSAPAPADRRALERGQVQLAVGTHALIQESVRFQRLGLAVIDEQHRFGVAQRQTLRGKGDRPDVLVMTATPIPRTLQLAAYGDLDTSVLDELPSGRTPISTELAPAAARREVYARLLAALDAGAQAYVVFPLIDDSAEIAAASVAKTGERVRAILQPHASAVLHGRIPAPERDAIMAAFASGKTRVLIATSVIEVGVDVPTATWMVIESAERFGLAQLHQLRGRVGRGAAASRCIAIHASKIGEDARRRLDVFASTTDGFRLAEADLAMRGPGELLGKRQAGLASMRIADLVADREWLEIAREDALASIARLDEPGYEPLRQRLRQRLARGAQAATTPAVGTSEARSGSGGARKKKISGKGGQRT